MRRISSDAAPAAIGPYSQAVVSGNLIFVSGQLPIDPASGAIVEGGASEQTRQSMKNIAAILGAAGCGLEDIVKTTILTTDLSEFGTINEVYAKRTEQKSGRCRIV